MERHHDNELTLRLERVFDEGCAHVLKSELRRWHGKQKVTAKTYRDLEERWQDISDGEAGPLCQIEGAAVSSCSPASVSARSPGKPRRTRSMRQFTNYADQRSTGSCIHCGGADETRDHVPSRVLLDEPYPENLGTSPSCTPCNNSLLADEEYLACLLECVLAGDVEPSRIPRPKVAQILRRSTAAA